MNAFVRQLHPSGQLPLAARGQRGSLRLSHSRKQVMVTCGRKYKLTYVEKLESIARPATLLYGSVVHSTVAGYLTALAFDVDTDPIAEFRKEWQEETTTEVVQYSTGWDAEEMAATGVKSLHLFMEDWADRGWTVLLDAQGVPVVERELEVRLPNGDTYLVIMDVMVRDAKGRVLVVDFKTPATAAAEFFASLSDQLMGYQLVADAHAKALGIEKVDGVVFYELVKKRMPKTARGAGPTIHVDPPAIRRSQEDLEAFVQELMHVANDIRAKRFAMRPMDFWCSPCKLCDFQNVCSFGNRMGLRERILGTQKALSSASKDEPIAATLI